MLGNIAFGIVALLWAIALYKLMEADIKLFEE